MNFQGKEAISRATRASGRTLLLLSLILILFSLGWIDLTENSILGIKVQQDKFVPLLKILCLLAALSHLVQWYSDYVSYRGWNVSGKLSGASRYGAPSKTKFEDLLESSDRLGHTTLSAADEESEIRKIQQQLDELFGDIRRFDNYAKFYVFGWHLVLPLGAAFVAFFFERHA